MSRFLEAVRAAESIQSAPRTESNHQARPFKVVSVASNEAGGGKAPLACNLAVYIRAMRENLPILILTLGDQLVLDWMFSIDGRVPAQTLLDAIRCGDLSSAIKPGQFGIRYVPASRDGAGLKSATRDLYHLQRVLDNTAWHGLVLIDTRCDFEILTQNAIMASDLVMVAVKDYNSLLEGQRVFDLLDWMERPRENARIVLSLMDLDLEFGARAADVLELLVSEIRRREYPLFESFISHSATSEALQIDPGAPLHSVMHGPRRSVTHRQMALLAAEVLRGLDDSQHGEDEAFRSVDPFAREGQALPTCRKILRAGLTI